MAVVNEGTCPFCQIAPKRIILQNEFGFAVRDGFPVSEGHSLIIPKRHEASFFNLSVEEQHGLLELLNQCKKDLTHISLCSPASLYRYPETSNSHSGLVPKTLTAFAGQAHPESSSPVIPDSEPETSISSRHSGLDPESSSLVIPAPEPESIPSQNEVKVPSDFNIGINDGAAAGQTVPHCHIHLIPRYQGDVKDPRGGVRWVIPEKANYWSGRK